MIPYSQTFDYQNHTLMSPSSPLILGFAAFSGTGKTSLLTRLIPLLKDRNLRIAAIKHSHHDFEIDYPGKDSHSLRSAGASPVLIASPYRRAIITEFEEPHSITLDDQVSLLASENLDLILVEGFHHEAFNKIELHRPSLGKPLLYPNDPNIIAIASDQLIATGELPWLDLNHPAAIAEFIINLYQNSACD